MASAVKMELTDAIARIPSSDYELLCRTRPEYYRQTELLNGLIVKKMTKSSEHDYLSQVLYDLMAPFVPKGYFLRAEKGLVLGDSELEPDISLVKGHARDYRHIKPSSAVLVVEVSVSSFSTDRIKGSIYAKAGIHEYWIVDSRNKSIIVYSQPSGESYLECLVYTGEGAVPFGDGAIIVANLYGEDGLTSE